MVMRRDYRLERFILNTHWENLPEAVQTRLKVCLIDLVGALIVGADSDQFRAGKKMVDEHFKTGEIAVIGSRDKYDFFGASAIMGHASNAYDIDDGHNIIRAHPGTSFIGGLLAKGYELDVSLEDFLVALYVSYEATIRIGIAIMDFYQYTHSSGTFGSFGVASGVGRLSKLSQESLNNLLSIAEFHGPLVPSRSASYPSMNKDGVPFGTMIGALACLDAESGFIGNMHLLDDERYGYLKDDLGTKHHVLDLYFKPYPCCRWSHAAIDASLELLDRYRFDLEEIERVTIYTFEKATQLSQAIPTTIDEAQYNITYPVASAILYGDFTIDQVNGFNDPKVHEFMEKIICKVDPEIDNEFPAKRYSRVEILVKSGESLASDLHEPKGEAKDRVDVAWIEAKFRRITHSKLDSNNQTHLIDSIRRSDQSVRWLVDEINQALELQ